MNRNFSYFLVVAGILVLLLGSGFFLEMPFVTQLFPWTLTRLSAIFIASICAASAMPIIWIGLSGETAAIRGGAIDLGVTYSAMAIFCFQLVAEDNSRQPILFFGIATGILGLSCWAAVFIFRKATFQDSRPTPPVLRYSFVVFAVVLLLVGGALVLKTPNVFPWPPGAEVSVMYGWIFLGAMIYFIYAVYQPMWANASGQLIGFLAYDIVLIVPFLGHFGKVSDDLRLNLIIYVAVITYSGLLAIYFLFIHKETRLFGAAA